MNKEKHTIHLENKIVVLTFTPFDSDVDVDELTKIHYHNMMGEVLTCSVLLNRVGILLAEMDEYLSNAKLRMEIFLAQQEEIQRAALAFETTDSKGNTKVKTPTVSEVEAAIKRSNQYRDKKIKLNKVQKERDFVNSLYWAVKDKSEKVNKLTDKIIPEEMENNIVEEKINGVMIKLREKAIK